LAVSFERHPHNIYPYLWSLVIGFEFRLAVNKILNTLAKLAGGDGYGVKFFPVISIVQVRIQSEVTVLYNVLLTCAAPANLGLPS
jgi:hypothetical protein